MVLMIPRESVLPRPRSKMNRLQERCISSGIPHINRCVCPRARRLANWKGDHVMIMKVVGLVLLGSCSLPLCAQEKENARLKESYDVLKEIQGTPDKGIPKDLLEKAKCVIVFPSVKKAAFIVGGEYGRGAITCRSGPNFKGSWSAPAMFALEGASIGFQIGGEATDFVLLVMNDKGANSVM